MRLPVLLMVLVAFGGFSTWLTVEEGYLGWVRIALRERWMVQVLIDLGVSLVVAWAFLLPDARARGLPAWPYVLGTFPLGSLSVLAYLIHRELAARAASTKKA